jgi:hypothetical protein
MENIFIMLIYQNTAIASLKYLTNPEGTFMLRIAQP